MRWVSGNPSCLLGLSCVVFRSQVPHVLLLTAHQDTLIWRDFSDAAYFEKRQSPFLWLTRCFQVALTNSMASRFVSALRLVGCGFNPQLGHTKECINGPIASLLGTQYSGLDLGGGWHRCCPPPSGDGSNSEDKFHILWDCSNHWDFNL